MNAKKDEDMNSKSAQPSHADSTTSHVNDQTKLLSILALAAGAMAAPNAAQSALVPTVDGRTVSGSGSATIDLPGNNNLLISALTGGSAALMKANAIGFAPRNNAGVTWNAAPHPGGSLNLAQIVLHSAGSSVFGQNSFTDKYIAFSFQDTTAGNAVRFGALELSATAGATPSVTIIGWEYENTGLNNFAFQPVPEAATGAWGALALGAVGLRAWRNRKRTQEAKA
jgi:hypothetical protein